MTVRDAQAAKTAIVASLMAAGQPAEIANAMANAQVGQIAALQAQTMKTEPAKIFGVPWPWLALGAAITVILLVRK